MTAKDIILPAVWSFGFPQKGLDSVRESVRSNGPFQGLQADLLRSPISLFAIADDTTGDNIFPAFVPSTSHRNNMIEGELAGRKTLATVLASMMISRINIGSGEPDLVMVPLHLDVSQQSQDRRKSNQQRNTSNLSIIFLDDLNLFLEQHPNSTLPGNHLYRLVS